MKQKRLRLIPKLPEFFVKEGLRPLRAGMLLFALILILQAGLMVVMPLPMKWALDRFSDLPFLVQMTGLMIALAVLSLLLDAAEEITQTNNVQKMNLNLRAAFIDDLLSRTYAFHLKQRKIDLVGRISADIGNLELFPTTAIAILVRSIPSIVLIFGALWWMDRGLTIGLLIGVPLFYLFSHLLSTKLKDSEKDFRRQTQRFEDLVYQVLHALPLVKSLAAESKMQDQVVRQHSRLNKSVWQVRLKLLGLNSFFSGTRFFLRAGLLLLGGFAIANGRMTLGNLFALATYLDLLQKPVFEIAIFLTRYPKALASLERLEELRRSMDANPEPTGALRVPDSAEARTPVFRLQNGSVRFETQGEIKEPLLETSIALAARQATVVIGPSGAGKSTLLKVINGLVPLAAGQAYAYGLDVREFDIKNLRRRFRVFLQEDLLLPTTIRENLSIGVDAREVLADEDFWSALTAVNADSFVRALPAGLDSKVGEGGVPLSGGQNRRLNLARAFLKVRESDLIAFDEPTSGLDPQSADHVIKSILALRDEGKTVLWTTHRWTETSWADQIVKVNQGKIETITSPEVNA